MTITQSDSNALKSLLCFNGIVELELLTGGMSHTCVKVTTSDQIYLAKKLNQDTAITEISAALICANKGLSPAIIYHSEEWLVTEFITGATLGESTLNCSEKITTALMLMAKLHQLPPLIEQPIPALNTTKAVNCLFTKPTSFSPQERLILKAITESLSSDINAYIACCDVSSVVCHGDLNYTNILIDSNITNNEPKPWLIDFECSHLAPVEFDLAMFIAANNISPDQLSEVVNSYSTFYPHYRPRIELLTYYMLYSFFINGLWYIDNINDSEANNLLRNLAIEQWSAFDVFASKQSIDLPKLMALID